ncbi:Gp19/Gp15/Gp42 family protein [Curtobacterium sp. Curtsp57]|uniref:Gp19/Gp15/Gp42 family protein n=1 Tax=Curtobacterium sp. Curtsp57 TaxID=3243047 RepID=UPI0039B42180
MASVKVEYDDVANRYEGDLGRFEKPFVETQIADAVDYADARWGPFITQRLLSGVLTSGLYKRIIADAVLRVLRNPQGLASEGDGGYTYSTRATVASGNLWFTNDDVEILSGLFSQQTMAGTVAVRIPPR